MKERKKSEREKKKVKERKEGTGEEKIFSYEGLLSSHPLSILCSLVCSVSAAAFFIVLLGNKKKE